MKTAEIRKAFLEYFKANDHMIIESSSLVPGNDETLLFTNAGMVQFKDIFLGQEQPKSLRATSSQRCIRAGGKHNDLENVGYTLRHHTFFEMLGNFSFGDYFKTEAIEMAWDFLTNHLNLEKDKLWISVYQDDEEAAKIWLEKIGISKERLVFLGEEDNFWSMGDTGPCGPCSEIYYDHGEKYDGTPPGSDGDEGDRFVEIWNLVFMQFNKDKDGKMHKLPKPSVDTGMGLERIAAVMQGVNSNYEIDFFKNIISSSEKLIGSSGSESHKVIADHIRSVAFLILDGVLPSNEGRGYVLRRILRRAVRHGYKLGHSKPFLSELLEVLVKEMGPAYPTLKEKSSDIKTIIFEEEDQFYRTLANGMEILNAEIKKSKNNIVSGKVAFKLHDTFGFPFDLTRDVARENNFSVDEKTFNQEMDKQKSSSKAANKFKQNKISVDGLPETIFLGYESLSSEASEVLGLWVEGETQKTVSKEENALIVLDKTPFYAESGGQIGDQGFILNDNFKAKVTDCTKLGKVFVHEVEVTDGNLSLNEKVSSQVETLHRNLSAAHHSATHLLHAALKQVLGNHVQQKGSLVGPSKLRFDFSHKKAVTYEELIQIENIVNEKIATNANTQTEIMNLDDAIALGAEAMFDEKYENEVRVLSMADNFSVELCGGTHVQKLGEIETLIITSESSVSSGVRRIEALVGEPASDLIKHSLENLNELKEKLKVSEDQLSSRIDVLLRENKDLKKGKQSQTNLKPKPNKKNIIQLTEIQSLLGYLNSLKEKLNVPTDQLAAKVDSILKENKELKQVSKSKVNAKSEPTEYKSLLFNGIQVEVYEFESSNMQELRSNMDKALDAKTDTCCLMFGKSDKNYLLVTGVSQDLVDKIPASALISKMTELHGGKGGGRNEFAQGAIEEKNFKKILNSIDDVLKSFA